MKRYAVLLVMLGLVVSGCAKKEVTRTEPVKDPARQVEPVQPVKDTKTTETQIKESDGKIVSADGSSVKVDETEGIFRDVNFEYDKYDVKESYHKNLKAMSSWLSNNPSARLSVEGHCDERGTNEYNLALGDRRAKAVRDFLGSLGVPSSKLDVISYGEEKPLCTDQTEDCWAKNRRAHFVVLTKAGK
jgi:peptidoglycan-associated lipoprotein